MRRALTIAGSDPSGGAGLQADLKTFHQFGVYGMSAVTLLTVQNTLGVSRLELMAADLVTAQIAAVAADIGVDAAKTGAIGSAALIEAVAAAVDELEISPLVVDPVMVSKHGHLLMESDAVDTLKRLLFPLATLITPNLHEAAALLGRPIARVADMERAARELADLSGTAVLVKGGALEGDEAVDVLYDREDCHVVSTPKLRTRHTHGSGCTYSAAITALLARGAALPAAIEEAKAYLQRAIAGAPCLGGGAGPVNHLV
jgi:hydroxymethylpyrimidine/phosphomethylpyrimidine kinase